MAHTTVTLYHKGCEFAVDVEADVTEGGSNSYGSDEPAWIEVSGEVYTHPRTGKRLSQRLTKWIESNHGDYVGDKLVEAHQEW